MRFTTCPVFLLALCIVNQIVGAASTPASTPAALPFRLTAQGAIIVPVSINGSESVSFLLDTGSNGSVVSDQLASSLGLRAVASTTMLSASGQKEARVVRIEHLTLGTVAANEVLATSAPADDLNLPDTAALGCKVQGVIGQDVLGHLRYTIAYQNRRIYWHESSADVPAPATRLELERQDDRFVVRLPQANRELRLVPDTGSEALVLFQDSESIATPVVSDAALGLTGLGGTRAARRAVVRALRVGETTLTDVPAVIVRREAGSAMVDGLLPLHFFARVTFDGPERQLFIEAR